MNGLRSLGGVVVEITLDEDDGSSLVSGSGGQIAQRTDQVGETAGGGSLSGHASDEVVVLLLDLVLDGIPEGLSGKVGEVVVREILQLELVGGTLESGGVCRGDVCPENLRKNL